MPLLRSSLATCLLLLTLAGIGAVLAQDAGVSTMPRVSHAALHNGGASLGGQWKFRAGDDLAWAAPAFDDSSWASADMPGRWPKGGYPDSDQFAWYRLTLQLVEADGARFQKDFQLAVQTGKVMSAFELYADGNMVGGVGKLPPLSEVSYDQVKVFSIPHEAISEDGTLSLALRVWGGPDVLPSAWGAGPYDAPFILGNYSELLISGIGGQIPGLLACVVFIGFGLYHIYLYRRNRQLDTFLWFGLLAINISVYGLMLNQLKYEADLSFVTLKKIEFGALYLFPALVIQLIWRMMEAPLTPLLRAYQACFFVFASLVVIVPGLHVNIVTLAYFQLLCAPLMFLAPLLMIRKVMQGHAEARTLFIGAAVFFATCVNDLMIDVVQLETVRLMPYGFIAILVAMAVSLANRFTTHVTLLEDEVAERTRELNAINDRLAEAAREDPLTGLLNRRGFIDEAEVEIQRVFRGGKPFSVVLADIDHFKKFNDEHGHACGDYVLTRVAAILEERIRDVDRIARWGGEEFILLLPETDAEGATTAAQKLCEAVGDNVFDYQGRRLRLTLTLGVSSYRKGHTLDACIAGADAALYRGKNEGRNRVSLGDAAGLSLVN